MVDFQSRNTRRGSSTDDDTDGEINQPEDAEDPTETEDRTGEGTSPSSRDRSGVCVLTVDAAESARAASDVVRDRLEADGLTVIETEHVEGSYDAVQGTVDRTVTRRDVEAVVTVGGTGVGETDVTVEAVEALLDKQLPGFGELFRVSYHERVGTDVVSMRPTAGISDGVPVFCLPGDPDAAAFATGDVLLGTIGELLDDGAD
ncbi:MogA/MoaB family molybdenum cofactor biosynthesis protein [Halorhabdus amylolytica]|uniref:MogA/MoaB family molybdenum cofactor biosynthesis protein n=1 Tax=Halorhabdus amylolytica TaxID=2559573 RepID=UPI0010A9C3D1|nr:molybdopterin-binding protein [Halorhabdus amylolytica]